MLLCAAPGAHARALYATDGPGNRIFGFAIASDGGLSWLTGFPVFSGQGPSALVPGADGRHVYATFAGANTVGVYTVGADGSLSAAGSAVATGLSPSAVAVSPSGTRLFVADAGSNSVSRYGIDGSGALTSLGAATTVGGQPSGLAMTPDGNHLYVANSADDNVSVFAVDSLGGLTPIGQPASAGDGPVGLAVTPDGHQLFATNSNGASVSAWTIESDGKLTSTGDPVAAGTGARSIAVSPDGGLAFVANPGASTISRYLVAPSGGLASAGTAVAGPTGVMSVVVGSDGTQAYAGGSSAISVFDLSSLGVLTQRAGYPVTTNGSHGDLAIPSNLGPEAKFDVEPAPAGHPTKFEGGPSSDPDGSVSDWQWDFGDGASGSGQTPTHPYTQPGTYQVKLTVRDNEGCGATSSYTGQSFSCVGNAFSVLSKTITVSAAPPLVTPDPPCVHDGDDGFCGTPDHKAPVTTVLGFNDGASISTVDAPTDIVGTITPDPSGVSSVKLRFTKAAGTIVKKKRVTKRVCSRRKGHKKRRCRRKRVVRKVNTKIPACLAPAAGKNYLVRYDCSKVKWIEIGGDTTFRYSLPVALGLGSYTVDAIAVDGAGNSDILEQGRNHMTFKVVNTPSNQGDTSGGTTGGTGTTTTTTPVDDTGSPFGKG